MMASGTVDGWTITYETEQVEVTDFLPTPDPLWSYTDLAGHLHTFNEPNWVVVYETPWYCRDCREIHTDTIDHYECPDCGEHLVPGTKSTPFRKFVPGPVTIRAIAPDGAVYEISRELLKIITTRLQLRGPVPGLVASLVAPGTVPCPRGGLHNIGIEEGSSGVEYRFCTKCGEIFG